MSSTYIETGSRVRVYDSAVHTHEKLPLGTYKVHFDSKEGFSLLKVDDLRVGESTIYGKREQKVDKIFRAYDRSKRSLGVMLSGDKGIGKSLFLRMIAEEAQSREIPVVLVTEDADGIAEFLDTLDECLIVFDEFEKNFPSDRRGQFGQANRQNQFLSLFDGMSSVKRIYCLTINDVQDVSPYIVNRPGRFHYHMRFEYPGPDEVRQYLSDQAPDAPEVEIENAALFSRRVHLNYDHLRAIAFELNSPNAQFTEIVEDLNIKPTEPSDYRVVAKFEDGTVYAEDHSLNLFERGNIHRTIELRSNNRSLFVSFLPSELLFEDDGQIYMPVGKIEIVDDDHEELEDDPINIVLTLIGQNSYAFDGF